MRNSNYVNMKYYPTSKYSSLNNLNCSKQIKDKSAIKEKLTTIYSDIDELYKKYQLTKQERIDKEKSQRNLVKRINFLADEQKKMNKKCEIQLRKINNLKKINLKNNIEDQKSPVTRKKTYDFANYKSENVSNRKKFKNNIIPTLNNNNIYKNDKNDNDLEEYSNTNITNNICIIINNNKDKNKDDYNIQSNDLTKTFNSEIGINNRIRYKKNKKLIKNEDNDKSPLITNSRNNEIEKKNDTPKFKQSTIDDKNSKKINNNMKKNPNIKLNKSQDILVIKSNQGFYFRNINNRNRINKNYKNNNLEESEDENNNSFLSKTTTNMRQKHFELKKQKNEDNRISNNETLTEHFLHANKTLSFNKIIELKKQFLGINSIDLENEKKENNIKINKEFPKNNSNENKQLVNNNKEDKTKYNSVNSRQKELNKTNKTIADSKLNIISVIKNTKNQKSKATIKKTTNNLLKNLDIVNSKNKKNNEEITNSYNSLIKTEKLQIRKKKISIDTTPYILENHPKTIISKHANCNNTQLNENKKLIKIIRKIQGTNELKKEENISKLTINNTSREGRNIKDKNIEKENTNIIVPRKEIETLRRINIKIENFKKNYKKNILHRRNIQRNLNLITNSETKRKKFNLKSPHSVKGSFSGIHKNILNENSKGSSFLIHSHKFKKYKNNSENK